MKNRSTSCSTVVPASASSGESINPITWPVHHERGSEARESLGDDRRVHVAAQLPGLLPVAHVRRELVQVCLRALAEKLRDLGHRLRVERQPERDTAVLDRAFDLVACDREQCRTHVCRVGELLHRPRGRLLRETLAQRLQHAKLVLETAEDRDLVDAGALCDRSSRGGRVASLGEELRGGGEDPVGGVGDGAHPVSPSVVRATACLHSIPERKCSQALACISLEWAPRLLLSDPYATQRSLLVVPMA